MSRFSYTGKLTMSITIEEVEKYADILVSKKELEENIKQQLMQTVEGMIGGERGRFNHDDEWQPFFLQLQKEGVIKLNQAGIDRFR